MSSQLPNIKGNCGYVLRGYNIGGAFYSEGRSPAGTHASTGDPLIHLDVSRYNPIYKDNVNEVFGESVAMNAFIKAKSF